MSLDPCHMDPSAEEMWEELEADADTRRYNWRQIVNARELSRSDHIVVHGQDGKPDTDEVEDRPQALEDTTKKFSVKRLREDPMPTFSAPLKMIPMPEGSSHGKPIDLTTDEALEEEPFSVESPTPFGFEPPLGFPMVSPMPAALLKFSYLVSHLLEVGPTAGLGQIFCGRYKHLRTGQLYAEHKHPLSVIEYQVICEWHKIERMLMAGDFVMAMWKMVQYCGFDK